jgi:hypothetical protein
MKVYSVTIEVKLVIKAHNRGDAILFARDAIAKNQDKLESLTVTNVFCPAEGK